MAFKHGKEQIAGTDQLQNWAVLGEREDIPELAELSGLSEEYLTKRYESAKSIGPKWTASIIWPFEGET